MDGSGPGAAGILGADRRIVRCDLHGEIAAALSTLLAARGFAPADAPLADLHRHLPPGAAELDDSYMNDVTRSFYALDQRVTGLYRRLIRTLAEQVLGFDFLFQAAPVVRFHPPARFPESLRTAAGLGSQLHSDILGGHPVGMVNGWLALTPTAGTNALQIAGLGESVAILVSFAADLAGGIDGLAGTLHAFYRAQREDPSFAGRVAAACRPLSMAAGDLVLFDARCLHGGAENCEATTRVSLDFRLIPLPDPADELESRIASAHPRWVRGEILDARSGRELAGSGGARPA